MSSINVNQITDALGGSTASINGLTPQASNMQPYNMVINGAMTVAQRGTGSAGLGEANDGYYTVDRWKFIGGGNPSNVGILTMSQETDAPDDFKYSTKFLVTTADTDMGTDGGLRLETHLEAQDVRHLNYGSSSAKQVTLSFWVKSNKTGSYSAGLYMDSTPSGSDKEISQGYTINASGTWEYKTLTFAPNTTTTMNSSDNDHGLRVWFHQASGSDYISGSSNTWGDVTHRAVGQSVNLYDATNNYWQITGVQLEAGSSASSFAHENYSDTLRKCQRYYSTGITGAGSRYGDNYYVSNGQHKVTLRATPTIVMSSGPNGYYLANQDGFVSYTAGGSSGALYVTYTASAEL